MGGRGRVEDDGLGWGWVGGGSGQDAMQPVRRCAMLSEKFPGCVLVCVCVQCCMPVGIPN